MSSFKSCTISLSSREGKEAMAIIKPEITSLWSKHAWAKRSANVAAGKPSYSAMKDRALLEVSKEAYAQIDADIPRTFISLPEELQPAIADTTTLQLALKRILLATEWRNSNANSNSLGSAYTQGMNALAAMCLAGLGWHEEERAFWLFTLLLEDVLSLSFFAEWPPLLAYHALNAVAVNLLQRACPRLASVLGEQLADVASMLSIVSFVTCFIYCLPAEPLLALWSDLLCGDGGGFRRRPLLYWFLGLLQHFETELTLVLQDPELASGIGDAALVFQTASRLMREISPGWRPAANVMCPPGIQLKQLVSVEEARIRDEAQDSHLLRLCKVERSLVDTLRREFAAMPREEGDIISFSTLCAALRRRSPVEDAETTAKQLFWLLDRDNSGSLDFFELMTGLLVLCEGSRDGKLRFLFDLYDTDQSGYLDRDELAPLSKALMKLRVDNPENSLLRRRIISMAAMPSDGDEIQTETTRVRSQSDFSLSDERCGKNAEHFRRRLLLLDKQGEGRLSFDDFRLGISGDAVLASCFAKVAKETVAQELPTHLASSPTHSSTYRTDSGTFQGEPACHPVSMGSSVEQRAYCRQYCRNLCATN